MLLVKLQIIDTDKGTVIYEHEGSALGYNNLTFPIDCHIIREQERVEMFGFTYNPKLRELLKEG